MNILTSEITNYTFKNHLRVSSNTILTIIHNQIPLRILIGSAKAYFHCKALLDIFTMNKKITPSRTDILTDTLIQKSLKSYFRILFHLSVFLSRALDFSQNRTVGSVWWWCRVGSPSQHQSGSRWAVHDTSVAKFLSS